MLGSDFVFVVITTRTNKIASFAYRAKGAYLNDVFRPAERDVRFVRDVCFASDVRFAREKRNASHHFAVKQQNITVCTANCIIWVANIHRVG